MYMHTLVNVFTVTFSSACVRACCVDDSRYQHARSKSKSLQETRKCIDKKLSNLTCMKDLAKFAFMAQNKPQNSPKAFYLAT